MVLFPVFLFADSEHLLVNRFLCVCVSMGYVEHYFTSHIYIFIVVCVCVYE